MVIQLISCVNNSGKVSFKSIREDINQADELKKGSKPLLDNKQLNIQAALNRLSTEAKKPEIETMLDIADNAQYGIRPNSRMAEIVSEEFEDVDTSEQSVWFDKLKETIQLAINNEKSEEIQSELNKKFEKVFGEKKPLTKTQEGILAKRADVLKRINAAIILDDDENLSQISTVKKLLDYFVISPDIPENQKLTCLEKMDYFLGDEYKINPQLKDKKIQALGEMLNDLIIKTPEQKELLIKDVNQKQSGICGAISVCRKALAYEDKVHFMEVVMNELDDSEYMEVYDITNLASGKKVKAEKAYIDYEDALRKNYRILDASSHIWMQLGTTVGKGDLTSSKYVAFDKEDYGVLRDSFWYPIISEETELLQSVQKYVIKAQESLEEIEKSQKVKNSRENTSKAEIQKQSELAGNFRNAIISELQKIFPEKDSKDLRQCTQSLVDFYSNKDTEDCLNINEKMPEEEISSRLVNQIMSSLNETSEEKKTEVKQSLDRIKNLVEGYIETTDKLEEAKDKTSPRSQFLYNKKLFLLAAAHRLGVEESLYNNAYLTQMETEYNIPARGVQQRKDLEQKLKQAADADEKILIAKDINTITTTIPDKIEEIVGVIYDKKSTDVLLEILQAMRADKKKESNEDLKDFAERHRIKATRQDAIKLVDSYIEKLQNSPTFEQMEDAIRFCGFADRTRFGEELLNSYMEYIQSVGIPEPELKRIEETTKKPIGVVLSSFRKDIENLKSKVEQIEDENSLSYRNEIVLRKMEKDGFVLSRSQLDALENTFDNISDGVIKNEKLTDKKLRKRKNNELFKSFTDGDKKAFKTVEDNLARIKRHTSRSYNSINNILKNQLNSQYAYIGKLQGNFWLNEDGGTGLFPNQTIRIFEQMTGKPYYMETDAKEGAKQIESGDSSGISSTSVDDKDYAMHAQYVKSITEETIENSSDKSKSKVKVLWHDNSWGKVEKDKFWTVGDKTYTDYGGGYGWSRGYIVNENMTTGTPLEEFNKASGYSKTYETKFPLFRHFVLQGNSPELAAEMSEIFENMFEMSSIDKNIDDLETSIKNGEKINIPALEGLDDIAYKKAEKLQKRLDEEIKTPEDYDKLSDDDELKLNIDKLAIYLSFPSRTTKYGLYEVNSRKELNEIKDEIVQEELLNMDTMFGKTPNSFNFIVLRAQERYSEILPEVNALLTEPMTENDFTELFVNILNIDNKGLIPDGSLDSMTKSVLAQTKAVLEQSFANPEDAKKVYPVFEKFIKKVIDEDIKITSLDGYLFKNIPNSSKIVKAIDNHFNPKSDEELIRILQSLQNSNDDEYSKKMEWLNVDDIVDSKDPHELVSQLIRGYNKYIRDFHEMITSSSILDNLSDSKGELAYRKLYVRLSDLNIDRFIKAFRNEMLSKYKVRPAFPELKAMSDEEIIAKVNDFTTQTEEYMGVFANNEVLMAFYQTIGDLQAETLTIEALDVYNENFDSPITKTLSEEEKSSLTEKLRQLDNLSQAYTNLGEFSKIANEIIDELSDEKPNIRKLRKDFSRLYANFDKNNYGASVVLPKVKQNERETIEQFTIWKNFFVDVNILPKYKNDANKIINDLVRAHKSGSEEAVKKEQQKLVEFTKKYHITKEPLTLLETYVKTVQNKNSNPYVEGTLKAYLKQASEIAQLHKVEFNLVKSANSGMVTKIGDALAELKKINPDGSLKSGQSRESLIDITRILQNKSTNNTTLNLFLTQTGLNEVCVDTLIDAFQPEARLEGFMAYKEIVANKVKNMQEFQRYTQQFFDNNKMRFSNYESVINQMSKFIRKKYENKSQEEQVIVEQYIEMLKKNKYGSLENEKDMLLNLLQSATNDYLQVLAEEIKSVMAEMELYNKNCEGLIQIINSIDLNEDCNAAKHRIIFMNETVPEFYTKVNEIVSDILALTY